jgi:serine/threonine-protein kinase RsbW
MGDGMKDQITLTVPPDLKYIRLASLMGSQVAETIYHSVGLENGQLFCHAFELALSEAFANAVKHGKGSGPEFQIVIEFEVHEAKLTVTVKDRNPPFGLDGASPLDLSNHPESGYGLFLLKQVMDTVTYRREKDWNMITMTKKLARSEKGESKTLEPHDEI